ncbi:MAG: response regulator [Planctomycetia bacterium]
MIQRLIGSHIDFVVETAEDLGRVKADPTQIGQVLLNLTANARDAMPDGGRLVVKTANAEWLEEDPLRPSDVKPGRYAVLSVADTGTGIAPDVLPHLFEPFFTTKPVGEGTGLGLATVYGIAKQSDGHVDVASTVNVGAVFRLFLPLIEEHAVSQTRGESRPSVRGNETVLLVEDEPMVMEMTAFVLQQNGYEVLTASNGMEAIAVVERWARPIELLLTDLVLPRMSGRELAARLNQLKPDLKVLFMSGYTEVEVLQKGLEAGAVDFLAKPFSLEALTLKVREILDR